MLERSTIPHRVIAVLTLGLLAASQAANIIKIGSSSPVLMTAWRLTIAAPILLLTGRVHWRNLRVNVHLWKYIFISAMALSGHFFTWIYAVQHTTVAIAVMILGTNPIFTALLEGLFLKVRYGRYFLLSCLLAIASVAVLLSDSLAVSVQPSDMYGWVSAIISSFFFSIYFISGRFTRQNLTASEYMGVVYSLAACFSFLVLLVLNQELISDQPKEWLCFALLAFIPTLMGHTSFAYALKSIPPSWLSITTLSEPLLASVGAYIFWGEELSWSHLICFALITLSLLSLLAEHRQRES